MAGEFNLEQEVEVEISISGIVDALLQDQRFINAVALAIRTAQTKQVRTMGNLYGKTAEKPKPTPATKRRLT